LKNQGGERFSLRKKDSLLREEKMGGGLEGEGREFREGKTAIEKKRT